MYMYMYICSTCIYICSTCICTCIYVVHVYVYNRSYKFIMHIHNIYYFFANVSIDWDGNSIHFFACVCNFVVYMFDLIEWNINSVLTFLTTCTCINVTCGYIIQTY